MRVIAFLRRRSIEVSWGLFAAANLVAMGIWPSWETIPFHFVWISLTLLYGFRVWGAHATTAVLFVVIAATGSLILSDAFAGTQLWGELFEVPLMSAMFLAMVWHARRRQEALRTAEQRAEEKTSLLARQERFLHDASHELRTPVTIARGHLEVLTRLNGSRSPEITIALDELQRIERSSTACSSWPRPISPTSSSRTSSRSSRSSRMSSSAGRRWRRARGGWAH